MKIFTVRGKRVEEGADPSPFQIIVWDQGVSESVFNIEETEARRLYERMRSFYEPPECEECGEVKKLSAHLVGTYGQARDFFGCDECADNKRDGTI